MKFSFVDLQALCKRSLFTKITVELTLLIQFRCFLLNIIKVTTIPSGKYHRSEWSSSSSTLYWFLFPQLCYISINQQRSELGSQPLSVSILNCTEYCFFPFGLPFKAIPSSIPNTHIPFFLIQAFNICHLDSYNFQQVCIPPFSSHSGHPTKKLK